MEFILNGEIPSKKNFWKIGRNKQGQAYIYNSERVNKWTYDNYYLLKSLYKGPKITGKIILYADFYIKREKDIDNMLGALQDLLQKVIIDNDSQIVKLIAQKFHSADNQKVYFKIKPYGQEENN